jgi:hypothetical protein
MESKEEAMKHLELLSQIKRMVESYLFPSEYDTEAIAVEIFFELWQKRQFVSSMIVRNRCIDEIRHKTCVKMQPLGNLEPEVLVDIKEMGEENSAEIVDILVRNARLNADEKKMIYLSFYKNEQVPVELLSKIIDKLRKEAELIKKEE